VLFHDYSEKIGNITQKQAILYSDYHADLPFSMQRTSEFHDKKATGPIKKQCYKPQKKSKSLLL